MKITIAAVMLLALAGPALADEVLEGTEPIGDAAYGPAKGTVYSDGSVEGEPEGTVRDIPGDTDRDGRLSGAEDAAAHPAYGPSSLDTADENAGYGRGGKSAGDGTGANRSGGGKAASNPASSSGGGYGSGGKQAGDGPAGNR